MKRIGVSDQDVSARLRLVSELNRLCLSLKRARLVTERAKKREPNVRSSEQPDKNNI